jgi:hypothetical protein
MIDAAVMHDMGPDRRRGGILGWLVMMFLLVLVCVAGVGVFFARSIHVHEAKSGHDVQVDTPLGSLHVRQSGHASPESIGIPLYPGAKSTRNGDAASVDLSSIFGAKDLQIVAGKWETRDSIDKVRKFYQQHFPDMRVREHDDKVEMHSVEHDGKRIIVLRRVTHSDGDATEIALASVGEPKAN